MKNNDEMLEAIRKDRPGQVINKVLGFKLNEHGFYNVKVDMESMFFDTRVLHTHTILPYPSKAYENLSKEYQSDWRFENIL